MEEEQAQHKKCYNCGYYCPLYVKGNKKFNKADVGNCRAKGTRVEKYQTCERWIGTHYRIKRYSKTATQRALAEILDSLAQIRQIIEEEENGEEN